MMAHAKRPIFYTGGGVINSGPRTPPTLLRELVKHDWFPDHVDPDGPGRLSRRQTSSGSDMLGMHGSFEANHAMHDCDLMICVGARFDDRITGRLDAFSPHSKKIHIDIDASSINKTVKVDLGIIGDCAHVLEDMVTALAGRMRRKPDTAALASTGGAQIDKWRAAEVVRVSQLGRNHQAAARRSNGCGSSPRSRDTLYHHRSRPTSDVGGSALSNSRSPTVG